MTGAMAKRKYTDDERANAIAALAANGGNVHHTATQLGIPATTLDHWAKGDRHSESLKMGEEKKTDMAAALEDVAWKLLGGLGAKVAEASLIQATTALGIVIDKMRLLREQPTTISATASMTDDQRLAELRRLAERIRERRNGVAHANGVGSVSEPDGAAPAPTLGTIPPST